MQPSPDSPRPGQARPPNVIVIVIDALRAGNLGCYGAAGDASPVLDRLARDGLLFEDAFCTWNTTDQSLTTILTGCYPRTHGIVHHGDAVTNEDVEAFKSGGARLLAERLGEAGCRTLAVDWMGRWFRWGFDSYGYPPPAGFFNRLRLYARYMFDHLSIFRCYAGHGGEGDGSLVEDVRGVISTFLFTRHLAEIQDAAQMTDAGLELLDEQGEGPFFLFLHYWDVHTPYHAPRRFRSYRGTDPVRELRDRYEGAVRYVDQQIGRLLRGLHRRGRLDDTLFIVTSDHGESHTEHGIFFDHHGLYEPTIRVPLIVRYPGLLPRGRRVRGFVQHVDLVPTIMELVGQEWAGDAVDGVSLLPLIAGSESSVRPHVYCEESYVQRKRALRDGRYKYIRAVDGEGYCRYCHKVHGGVEELYDLRQDPGEGRNLAEMRPEVAARMREQLEETVRLLTAEREREGQGPRDGTDRAPLSEEEQRELHGRFRSLGYHG